MSGCYASPNERKHKPHTPSCRERIAKALAEDGTQSRKVADARGREDAFLENTMQSERLTLRRSKRTKNISTILRKHQLQ